MYVLPTKKLLKWIVEFNETWCYHITTGNSKLIAFDFQPQKPDGQPCKLVGDSNNIK
jgi:hypothetical protein